jgi:uncharacterized repeat protein (TIGR03803 family)
MREKALMMIAVTLILASSAWASSESVIYNFNSFSGDGYQPYTGLVADAKGNLYGTTVYGGSATTPYGTVFELKLSGGVWTETILHSFGGGTTDGAYPEYSSLVFDKTGNLYGTTYNGGTKNLGTVFELKHSGNTWTESLIHSFTNIAPDGYGPQAGLSFDTAGNLYGTSEYGGAHSLGTVFQMKVSKGKWTYKVIHAFAGGNSGYYPVGGLTQGKNGYYYGTTYYGGTTFNVGTVYRLFQARGVWVGQTVAILSGGASGTYPDSSLTMDAAGNFFGTTYQGGDLNVGTVFELKAGKNNTYSYRVLYSFKGGTTDGSTPWYGAGVTLDAKGNLYGATRYGGPNSNEGTAYELKLTSGHYKERVLQAFGTTNDGLQPLAGVILVKGKVYGTTYAGGAHGEGTVFEIKP